MRTIRIEEVREMKNADIRRYNADRPYMGNATADQKIDYILRLSDEEYMNLYNEVAGKENRKAEAAKAKKSAISAERKATGKSKAAYRKEYNDLMNDYKTNKNMESYKAAKAIAKFAF